MSKSFDTKQMVAEKPKRRKSLDFAPLYKTDEETSTILSERGKRRDSAGAEAISSGKPTPKYNKSSSKKKNKNKNTSLDISHIEGQYLNVSDSEKITSTPYAKETNKPKESLSVKSIIKNSSAFNNTVDTVDTPRSKKRNKSVSFMLDDSEETAVKKIKSNENSPTETSNNKIKTKRDKFRKKKDGGKENNEINAQENEEKVKTPKPNKKGKVIRVDSDTESSFAPNDSMENNAEAKKKFRKYRKLNKSVNADTTVNDNIENEDETKEKKFKKKNRHLKPAETIHPMESETKTDLQYFASENSEPTHKDGNNNKSKEKKAKKQKRRHKHSDNMETESTNMEPKQKSRKRESEPAPEVIAEDLENLNIGDNAHTLTHLLDEMSVVDKNKKRKNKNKQKTGKDEDDKSPSSANVETTDLDKIDEGKEKVIWKKRKWNKDKKVEMDSLMTSVIVENLPLKIIFEFRKILVEHFSKLGLVKNIGVAEVYPNEEPKPVFTTTVHFYSEGAATQALEEDNTRLEGSRMRIRRPLPATETTLVVRSYGELSEQALSSMFLGAGRVRSIRHAIKGRKSMGTAFVELDGPESLERGIALAQDAKIGGKKIHVAKFEVRQAKQPRSSELGSEDRVV